MSLNLTPPESLQPTPLTPPDPVPAVTPAQAEGLTKLDPATITALDQKVAEFVDVIVQSEVNSAPFVQKVQAIHNLGNDQIRASANVSNRMLERPMQSLAVTAVAWILISTSLLFGAGFAMSRS